MELSNELTVYEEGSIIAKLSTSRNAFCSFNADTREEKALLFAAMNSPDKQLRECINQEILLKHFYCEEVECTDKESGEVSIATRTVLIDAGNVSYQCVSTGVFNALQKLVSVYGLPGEWEEPVKIKIKQISRGERQILTFTVV